MIKDMNKILKEFQAELKVNDKKVQQEMKTKSKEEMSKDFVNFVNENNCKIKGQKAGGKNGK